MERFWPPGSAVCLLSDRLVWCPGRVKRLSDVERYDGAVVQNSRDHRSRRTASGRCAAYVPAWKATSAHPGNLDAQGVEAHLAVELEAGGLPRVVQCNAHRSAVVVDICWVQGQQQVQATSDPACVCASVCVRGPRPSPCQSAAHLFVILTCALLFSPTPPTPRWPDP